jgi:hypothetical protein
MRPLDAALYPGMIALSPQTRVARVWKPGYQRRTNRAVSAFFVAKSLASQREGESPAGFLWFRFSTPLACPLCGNGGRSQRNQRKNTMSKITGHTTLHNAVQEMWNRCLAAGLSRDELKFFARFSDAASDAANNLHDVVEGIGCLVSHDDQTVKCGVFQTVNTLPPLLFSISESLDAIAALGYIGSAAADELYGREEARP